MIGVHIDGQLWARTYRNGGGGSETELSDYPQSLLGVQARR